MATTKIELKVSKVVTLLLDEFQSYTPPAGSELIIDTFVAEGSYSTNSVAKLLWKFNTGSEQVLWSIRGHGVLPFKIRIPPEEVDGIWKVAVSCDNGDLSNLLMSAYVRIIVNDLRGG